MSLELILLLVLFRYASCLFVLAWHCCSRVIVVVDQVLVSCTHKNGRGMIGREHNTKRHRENAVQMARLQPLVEYLHALELDKESVLASSFMHSV